MTKVTINLEPDQIDLIIVQELKANYKFINNSNNSISDKSILPSIKAILDYYMTPSEFSIWKIENEKWWGIDGNKGAKGKARISAHCIKDMGAVQGVVRI